MKKYPVTIANDLIRKIESADEKSETIMSVMENRIRLMLISLIDYNAENFEWKEITVCEFKDFWDLNSWGGIQQKMLSEAIGNLKNNKYSVDGHNIQWLDNESNIILGRMKIKLNDSLKPYLLHLTNKFTKFDVENIVKLTSKYSFRIHEIMKSVENMGGYRITLPKAYEIFSGNIYSTKSELEYHILIPSIDEINTKTDINISYEFKKSFGENEMLYLTVYNYNDYADHNDKEISYFTVLGGSAKKKAINTTSEEIVRYKNSIVHKDVIADYDLIDCEPIAYAEILKSHEMTADIDFDDYIF